MQKHVDITRTMQAMVAIEVVGLSGYSVRLCSCTASTKRQVNHCFTHHITLAQYPSSRDDMEDPSS